MLASPRKVHMKTAKELETLPIQQLHTVKGGYVDPEQQQRDAMLPKELRRGRF